MHRRTSAASGADNIVAWGLSIAVIMALWVGWGDAKALWAIQV
jgi:hypothetical protein